MIFVEIVTDFFLLSLMFFAGFA